MREYNAQASNAPMLDVSSLVARYNQVSLVSSIGYAFAAIFLWFLSYAVVWLIAYIIISAWRGPFGSYQYAHWAATGAMVLLVISGMRHTGPLWDLSDYNSSLFSADRPFTGMAYAAGAHYGLVGAAFRSLSVAYVVTQLLLSAPRCTVLAVTRFRQRMHLAGHQIAATQRIAEDLQRSAKWVALDTYREQHIHVAVLQRLRLVWIKENAGQMQVRIDPSYTGQ